MHRNPALLPDSYSLAMFSDAAIDWGMEERLCRDFLGLSQNIDSSEIQASSESLSSFLNRVALSDPDAQMDPKSDCSSSNIVALYISIPNKSRSVVIGKRGRTMKALRRQYNVDVSVKRFEWDVFGYSSEYGDQKPGYDTPVPIFKHVNDGVGSLRYPQRSTVCIKGEYDGCEGAKREIVRIVKSNVENVAVKLHYPRELEDWSDEITENLSVEYPSVKILNYTDEDAIVLSGSKGVIYGACKDFRGRLEALKSKIHILQVPIPYALHDLLPSQLDKYPKAKALFSCDVSDHREGHVKVVGAAPQVYNFRDELFRHAKKFFVKEVDLVKQLSQEAQVLKAVYRYLKRKRVKVTSHIQNNTMVTFPYIETFRCPSCPTFLVGVAGRRKSDVEHAMNDIVKNFQSFLDRDWVLLDIHLYWNIDILSKDERFSEIERSLNLLYGRSPGKSVSVQSQLALAVETLRNEANSRVVSLPLADGHAMMNKLKIVPGIFKGITKANVYRNHDDKTKFYIASSRENIESVKTQIYKTQAEIKNARKAGLYKTSVNIPSYLLTALLSFKNQRLRHVKRCFKVGLQIHDSGKGTRSRSLVLDKTAQTRMSISGIRSLVEAAKEYIERVLDSLAKECLTRMRVEAKWQCRVPGLCFRNFKKLEEAHQVRICLHREDKEGDWPYPLNRDEITIWGSRESSARAMKKIEELVQYEKDNEQRAIFDVPAFAIERALEEIDPWCGNKFEGYGLQLSWKDDQALKEKVDCKLEAFGLEERISCLRYELGFQIEQERLYRFAFSAMIQVPQQLQPELIAFEKSKIQGEINRCYRTDILEEAYGDFIISVGDEESVEKAVTRVEAWTSEKIALDRALGITYD